MLSQDNCNIKLYNLKSSANGTKTQQIVKETQYNTLEPMKDFLFSDLLSDVKFKIKDFIIPAHKVILSMMCPFFKGMFSSQMKESHSSEIEINDCDESTFREFLKYLYHNEIELNQTLALNMMELAEKYTMKELKTSCESFLAQSITFENIETLAQYAEKYELPTLKLSVINFVITNITEIKKGIHLKFSEDLLWDVIYRSNP